VDAPRSIRPASTVVLLRDCADGLEVFLVRRHAAAAFMGGVHVFPGGGVDDADRTEHVVGPGDAGASQLPDVDPATSRAFYAAAVRETFEETGVRLALESLVYFAWWVTPEAEPRRFDTRFFLAASPSDQVAAHDGRETTASTWIRAAEAIACCRRGEITLAPPTWTTLRWLEAFRDVDAALKWARSEPIHRIQPLMIQNGDVRIVTLPEGAPRRADGGVVEARFELKAGRWRPLDS
jgi:8-oxo-dGTP pyrophosphatase MutT (NUDIX family)